MRWNLRYFKTIPSLTISRALARSNYQDEEISISRMLRVMWLVTQISALRMPSAAFSGGVLLKHIRDGHRMLPGVDPLSARQSCMIDSTPILACIVNGKLTLLIPKRRQQSSCGMQMEAMLCCRSRQSPSADQCHAMAPQPLCQTQATLRVLKCAFSLQACLSQRPLV